MISVSILASQPTQQKVVQANTDPYPNSADGLRRLLNELLLAAKNNEQPKLQLLIAEMEIPNYESWFTQTFGKEKGESWAGPYGKGLEKDEKEFLLLWMDLAKQDGEIAVVQVDTAKRYDTLTVPLDEYIASWKKMGATSGPTTEPIGSFYYIEGKFRWNSTDHYVRGPAPAKGRLVAAKLIKKVQPMYPQEAREKKIEGTVALNVIIKKDGSVTVQNVAEGDPVLAPAAVEAVQQWRYEPFSLNGQPIDVQTKIRVVFALTQQPQ